MMAARQADRLEAEAKNVADRHGVKTVAVVLRRRDRRGLPGVDRCRRETFGGADILINNAGSGSNETIMEAPDEKWQHYWELHVMAAVRLARGIVPFMRERGGGVMLHNASICATQPLWYEPIYNVTKSALMMFSKTLANEVVKDNIRVNTVNAGADPDARLDQDRQAAHRRQGRRLGGLSAGRGRRARADPAVRHAGGIGGLLRVPVLGPRDLLDRLDLFRRRRHAKNGLT